MPGTGKLALVTAAVGAENVTVPGPLNRVQRSVMAPGGEGFGLAHRHDDHRAVRRDRELEDIRRPTPSGSRLERMLRGEHRAMVEVVDALAGADSRQRRNWELLLGGLVESMADIAVRESVIDFPMGTAFWDTFTVEQCRRVVASLASMGYRYDGQAGWADSRVPAYRDLTQALADVGMEPRRMRAWPNQTEIATLFVGARPAPEELLAAAGPDYNADDMQALLGEHAPDLRDLWNTWEAVKPALLAEDEPAAVDP